MKSHYQENEIADLNIGFPITKDEQYVALILQFVGYMPHLNPPRSASITSFLKEFYQIIVANDASRNPPNDVILKGCCNDIGILFAQLLNEMQRCQFKLHDFRVFHLDTGARNFLLERPILNNNHFIRFPLVLCDYGHSAEINMGGEIDVTQEPGKPTTSRDFRAVNNNIASVLTDIFALKCSLIGMVSVAIADLENDYAVFDIGQTDMDYFKKMRKSVSCFQNDSYLLAAYLNKLWEHIIKCPDENIKYQTELFINTYSRYICSMPSSSNHFNEAHEADRKLLLSSNVAFFKALIHRCVSNLHRVDDNNRFEYFLLTIQKLLTLPVTDEFSRSTQYLECRALTNVNMAREFVRSHFKPMHVFNVLNFDISFPISNEPIFLYWVIMVNNERKKWIEKLPDEIDLSEIKQEHDSQIERLINLIQQNRYRSLEDVKNEVKIISDQATARIRHIQSESSEEDVSRREQHTESSSPEPPTGYERKPT